MTCDASKIDPEQAVAMLSQTYWAQGRDLPKMKRIMGNSLNCGLLDREGGLVGYLRVVTDYETMFYLADVVVAPALRGHGLGKAMVGYILDDERLRGLRGILLSRYAQGLYEKFGFARQGERVMMRE